MPQSDWKPFDALPAYLGGKRKLAPRIFKALERADVPKAKGKVLLDPFMGGGSISLLGKALGYRIIANDASVRSAAVGEALIVNSDVKLSESDLALAYRTDISKWRLPTEKDLPMPDSGRELMAQLAQSAANAENPVRRSLLQLLLVKTILVLAPWGQVSSGMGTRVRAENWDSLTTGMMNTLEPIFRPKREARKQIPKINGGIFSNGERNEMHCSDVLEFLSNVSGDAVYLDPPYPGTVAYEDEYAPIDELLLGEELNLKNSRFSAKDGWKFLGDVYDAAEHIPVWILSLGNKAVDIDTLADMMRERGRDVEAHEVSYTHLASRATEENKQNNLEFIITAKKKESK